MGDMTDVEQSFLQDVAAALKADATDLGKFEHFVKTIRAMKGGS